MSPASRREHWQVGAAVLVGLLVGLLTWSLDSGTTPDSFEYMRGGQTLWRGQGFKSMSGADQLVFPPLYPALIGAASRILHEPVFSGRLVSLIASVASIAVFYLLVSLLYPGRAALVATWLFVFLPLRIWVSTMVWSESTFLALVLGGLLLWVGSLSRSLLGLACGLVLGAAYLARPEGLLVLVALAIASAALRTRGDAPGGTRVGLALMIVGFAAFSLPYLWHLRAHTGRWRPSGKTDLNLAYASAVNDAGRVPWDELQQLSDDDSEVVVRPRQQSLRSVARRYGSNARRELVLITEAVSPFLLVCIGLGLPAAVRSPRKRIVWAVSAALAGPLLVLPFFFVEERMLLVSAAAPIVLAAGAIGLKGHGSAESISAGHARATRALIACAFGWMALWLAGHATAAQKREPEMAPLLAAICRVDGSPGPIVGNIRAAMPLAFRAGRTCLWLPWAPLDRALRYADHHQASFLLFTTLDSPELAALAREPTATERLEPIARVEAAGGGSVVMQLYRVRSSQGPQRVPSVAAMSSR